MKRIVKTVVPCRVDHYHEVDCEPGESGIHAFRQGDGRFLGYAVGDQIDFLPDGVTEEVDSLPANFLPCENDPEPGLALERPEDVARTLRCLIANLEMAAEHFEARGVVSSVPDAIRLGRATLRSLVKPAPAPDLVGRRCTFVCPIDGDELAGVIVSQGRGMDADVVGVEHRVARRSGWSRVPKTMITGLEEG